MAERQGRHRETRETARGLIVNLSDVLFDTGKADLKPGTREKLSRLSGVLLSHPGLHVEVEGHADNVGATDFNQTLSESRAASVRDYLVRGGIAPNTVGTAGFGESQPVASNDTAAGKQQNRRVGAKPSEERASLKQRDGGRQAPRLSFAASRGCGRFGISRSFYVP